ncbi:MAG TPA: ABC transporter permease [Blastocatellia bacterium]|nr:ABC transporter permease [Blastocatellia bacterium]
MSVNSVAVKETPGTPASRGESTRVTDRPLVTIEAGRGIGVNLREVWAFRELLYFLTWRDVKVRYKQTLLGAAWVVLQPLLATAVFVLLFGRVIGVSSEGVPYALFAYAGLAPWTFFSSALTGSSNSIVGNSNLIAKVYFPRVIIPAGAICARLVDFAIALMILAVLLVYYRVSLSPGMLMFPVLVAMTVLLVLGAGLLLSALNVRYRDVAALMPFLTQMWMFASPIIYPASIFPARWRWVLILNPLTGIIEGYRSALFGKSFDWQALGASAAITLVLLFVSAYAFRRMERRFADIV